ncbi:hypothetical protein [Prosthecobacter sp.]|uniref:hypothetical protein n=1 Tax=Prosthecobacter sp. TaxID=1965333 RepID=UPI0025FE9260|nr:hypothetical protein [Prosthecobacter sp.]
MSAGFGLRFAFLAAFLAAGFALVAFLAIVLLAAVAVRGGYESAPRSVNANFINI